MRRRTARTLAALADGSLPPQTRDALMRRVARSARLSRALERQRCAVELIRSLTDPAPPELRAQLERATDRALSTRS